MKKTSREKPVPVTLDRVLSKLGVASRREAAAWIEAGRVSVNGRVARRPDTWVDMRRDVVRLDGLRLRKKRPVYLLLNKPKGLITTAADERARRTVYECLRGVTSWVFPVGRLDKDTSGLLIFTNDTPFANYLTDPACQVPKTYFVKAQGRLSPEQLRALAEGVDLGRGERSQPAQVLVTRASEKNTWLEITIREGKNRQVRRMLEAVGHAVRKLVRIRIGDLEIGDLPIGHYRALTPDEVRRLKKPQSRESKNPRIQESENPRSPE